MAGWRSELAGCRSTLTMSKIKVRISETKYRSFYKTLVTPEISQYMYLLKYIFLGPICKDVCSPSCKSSCNRVIVRRIRWKTNWVYCWGKRYMCCKFDNCKVITEQTLKILLFWWKGINITKKSSYFRFQRPSVSPLSLILTHSQNPHWELK